MPRFHNWLQHHRLAAFVVLAHAISWSSWPVYAPGLSQLTWTGLLMVFAVRLVNPMDGPLGEEPGFRGYAVPLLQAARTPLQSAAVLGTVVVAAAALGTILFDRQAWRSAPPEGSDVGPLAVRSDGTVAGPPA